MCSSFGGYGVHTNDSRATSTNAVTSAPPRYSVIGQTTQAYPSGRPLARPDVAGVSRRQRKCVDLNHCVAALSRMRGSRKP